MSVYRSPSNTVFRYQEKFPFSQKFFNDNKIKLYKKVQPTCDSRTVERGLYNDYSSLLDPSWVYSLSLKILENKQSFYSLSNCVPRSLVLSLYSGYVNSERIPVLKISEFLTLHSYK